MNFIKLNAAGYLSLIIFFASVLSVNAQDPTIGLQHFSSSASDGYTLFTPEKSTSVFLIDNCGGKINEWTFSEKPGATCYFLENGNLLRAGKDSLEIRDWNNNLIWSYAMDENGLKQHHDIEPMPNGNILCLLREIFNGDDIIAEGRDTSLVAEVFKLDKIVELRPIGTNDASIVWEWRFIDRLIQDKDNTKPNFGSVQDHPERLDANYDNTYYSDWTHANAIDYNAELDQIMITARHLSELYIIDHSTTTEEATGHSGGNSNRGGDFLWRWGNTQVYKQGSHENQKLFYPHDGKWVESGYDDYGKITVFNNGGDGSNEFSSIHLMSPVINDGIYQLEDNKFKPLSFDWTWSGSILGVEVQQDKKSGTHALPNGNFMICETSLGRVSEISRNGTSVWTYVNPVSDIVNNQYDTITGSHNAIFRAEKYPEYYAGFDGLDMTSQGIIENENPVSEACMITSVDMKSEYNTLMVNPVVNNEIRFLSDIEADAIVVTDLTGKTVYDKKNFEGRTIGINLKSGLYILQLIRNNRIETIKFVIR